MMNNNKKMMIGVKILNQEILKKILIQTWKIFKIKKMIYGI